MPLPITKQRRLLCSFVCYDILTCYGVGALSLSIPHGMHLVVPTHPYFFWTVCHPSRTFPPKEPEQEPHNRFSPLLTARPLPSYLWPITHHLLYWLDTSWWSLGLAGAQLLRVSKTCPLVCTSYCLSLTSYGVSYFLIPHSLWPTPLKVQALLDCGLFFLQPILLFVSVVLLQFPTVPLCHSCCGVIWPQSTRPLWVCCLFFFQWLNVILWALYYIAYGLFCPIYFLLGILGPFAFLGLPWPFF